MPITQAYLNTITTAGEAYRDGYRQLREAVLTAGLAPEHELKQTLQTAILSVVIFDEPIHAAALAKARADYQHTHKRNAYHAELRRRQRRSAGIPEIEEQRQALREIDEMGTKRPPGISDAEWYRLRQLLRQEALASPVASGFTSPSPTIDYAASDPEEESPALKRGARLGLGRGGATEK